MIFLSENIEAENINPVHGHMALLAKKIGKKVGQKGPSIIKVPVVEEREKLRFVMQRGAT